MMRWTSRDQTPPSNDFPDNVESLRLTPVELEIMDVVWRLGEATVRDVCSVLTRPLAYTSVMTTLRLLQRKRQVLERTKRGRSFVYRPLITREQASRSILRQLTDVLFRGSVPSLVQCLLADITEREAATLCDAIDELERNR